MIVKQQSFATGNDEQGEEEEEDYFEGYDFDDTEKSVNKYEDELERPGDLRRTLERPKAKKEQDTDEEDSYYS